MVKVEITDEHRQLIAEFLAMVALDERYAAEIARRAVKIQRRRVIDAARRASKP